MGLNTSIPQVNLTKQFLSQMLLLLDRQNLLNTKTQPQTKQKLDNQIQNTNLRAH